MRRDRASVRGRAVSVALAALALSGVTRCRTVVDEGGRTSGGGGSVGVGVSAGGGGASTSGPGGAAACGVTRLASGFSGPASLALQGDTLFWKPTDPSGSIAAIPVSGGASSIVVTDSGFPHPVPLAATATRVFWVSAGVWSAPLPGGAASVFDTDPTLDGPAVADADRLYVVDDGTLLVSLPLAASDPPPTTLVTLTSPVVALAEDADHLYWVDTSTVNRVAKAGGAATFLSSGLQIVGLAIDAEYVYFADFGAGEEIAADAGPETAPYAGGSLFRVPKAGGGTSVVATGLDLPGTTPPLWPGVSLAMAVDATHVYWWDQTPAVQRAPVGGGAPELVVPSGSIDMMIPCPPGVCWTHHGETLPSDPYGGSAGDLWRFVSCP